MRALLLALVGLASFCDNGSAQRRWIVDGSNASMFANIVAGAGPGDVILLRTAIVGRGTVITLDGKGITIRGDGISRSKIIDSFIVTNVPAGQSLHLDNVWFSQIILIDSCVGAVLLRNVLIAPVLSGYGPAFRVSYCSQVDLIDSTIRNDFGYGNCASGIVDAALFVERSRMTLSRCFVFGSQPGSLFCWSGFGSPSYWRTFAESVAIEARGSSLLLFDTYVERFHPSSPGTELTGSRFVASPPPMQWINGRAGISQVHLYGSGASAGGSVVLTQNSRLLPSTRATLTGNRLRLEVRNGGIDSPGFMGIGLQPAHVLLSPFGHHGAILVPTNQSQSAVFDRLVTDATGTWTREYVVPQPLLTQLLDHYFVFQALMLDPSQTIWAGSPDVVRF